MEVGQSQASAGRGQFSKRQLLAKKTAVTGTVHANGQVFTLRVVFSVRRETIVEYQTCLVKLHVSKDKSQDFPGGPIVKNPPSKGGTQV